MHRIAGISLIGLFCPWVALLRAEDEAARFMPADVELVVYVNVQQLVDSAVVKKHALEPVKSILKDNAEAQKALEVLGIDPLRDIHTVHLGGQANIAPKLLLVIKGEFNVDKLHEAATAYVKAHPDKTKVESDGNLKIYEITESGITGYVLVLDRGTILIGRTKDYVVSAARQKETKLKKELQTLVQQQDARKSLWFVGIANDEIRKQLGGDPRTAALAGKITAVSGHLLATKDVAFELRVHTTDARSAAMLTKFFNDLKAMAVFATKDINSFSRLVSRALGNFKVSTDASVVVLSATVSDDMIKEAIEEIDKEK
jgi:hypothetical protein